MRNFAKTLAVMGALTPAGVNALGVGEIRLHSALNQKLLAEIPILAAPGEDPSQIQVRLASPQAFAKAGLSRPYHLTLLRFSKPVRRPDGSLVVQVTSADAIREPFLDFLVEVEWPQGRMLREFTVLLDPPLTYDDVVKVAQNPPGVTPAPPRRSRSAATVTAATAQGGAMAYGPVRRNESLWKIAERLKPDAAVTTEQMVMALYRKNPGAFGHDNVNELKVGATLKVPTREEILALSPREARREFQRQYKRWLALRAPEPEAQKTATAEEVKPAPQLKLEAPEETPETGEKAVEVPVVEGPDAGPAPETVEALAELRAENAALKARLEALEKRMAALLAVENAALAKTAAKAEAAAAGQAQPATPAPAAPVSQPEPPQPKAPATKPAPSPAPVKARTPAPRPAPAPEETGWGDPLYLSLGGGSLALLGVAGWLIWRRRTLAGEQADSLLVDLDMAPAPAEPKADVAETAAGTPEETAVPVTPAAGVEVAESSFLSEFTPSDFDILEADSEAVDPIAEADVYLAYGRYQQAEELIRQALAEEPENRALQLKLLEIYYANEDGDNFARYAGELARTDAREDEAFWSKVTEMAKELELDVGTFTADGAPVAGPETAREADAGAVEAETGTAETPEDARESGDGTPAAGEDDDAGLDFDLGDFDLGTLAPEAGDESHGGGTEQDDDDNVLEFSLNDDQPSEKPETAGEDEGGETFDLTDMDELDTKLDLARAYVDMDDVESARVILEEVLGQGNDKQRQEAQALMNRMGIASSS